MITDSIPPIDFAGSVDVMATVLIGPASSVAREIDVEGCLSVYLRDQEHVLVLNETASDVWRLADGSLTEARIVELLAAAYRVAATTIAPDVHATIERFVREGFLDIGVQ